MIKLFFIKILTILIVVIFPFVSFAFNESHLEKLKSLNECSQCDLISAILTKESLKNAVLNNAIEDEVVLHPEVLHAMDSNGAIEHVVNGDTTHVAC